MIVPTLKGSNSLPRMSNSPESLYILKNEEGKMKSLGVYNDKREIVKEIDIGHGHKVRSRNGKLVKYLKRGVAHTHTTKGGRENNTRYMTKKEKKIR